MKPLAILLDFHVLEELNEHFALERVVVLLNIPEKVATLGNKMNRKGSRLSRLEISHRNGRDSRGVRISPLIEALARIMDDQGVLGRLEDLLQLPLGALPFAV
jgi:hypothetical protein